MREQVTITPFGSPDNIDHVYFKEALKTLQRMLDSVEKFAESPSSAHGTVHLCRAENAYEYLFDLFGQEDAPFSHHMMNRLSERFGAMKWYHHKVQREPEASPSYSLGRNVERAISGIEAAIEEMELCVEYSDTSESLK